MHMTQKIIKIGSSRGITIPAKQLAELGLDVGDEVKVHIESAVKPKHTKFMHDLEKFMDTYDQDLKNLAKK